MKAMDKDLRANLPTLKVFMDNMTEFQEDTDEKIDEIKRDSLEKHNYQILKMRSDVDKLMKAVTAERMNNIDACHTDCE